MVDAKTAEHARLLRDLAKMLEQGKPVQYLIHFQLLDFPGQVGGSLVTNHTNRDELVGLFARLSHQVVADGVAQVKTGNVAN